MSLGILTRTVGEPMVVIRHGTGEDDSWACKLRLDVMEVRLGTHQNLGRMIGPFDTREGLEEALEAFAAAQAPQDRDGWRELIAASFAKFDPPKLILPDGAEAPAAFPVVTSASWPRVELTEDALADALVTFKDRDGNKLHASKIVCGTRAALSADRILHQPADSDDEASPFATVQSSIAVEIDPTLNPDEWHLA